MFDVIVIGAGISGLRVADRTAAAGLDTLVLEARNRVGGRLHSVPAETGAIDLIGLARDAAYGLPVAPAEEVPSWLESFPTKLEGAKPEDLARLDAEARRACLEAVGEAPQR